MKITCHSCSAKYTVSDDKVQGKTVKMKCRKCGATIVVGASSAADAGADNSGHEQAAGLDPAMEGGEGPPAGSFLVSVGDADQRTMTLAEVVEAYNSGVITAETYVWAEGMSDWQALSENQEIVAALNEAANSSSAAMSSGGFGAAAGFSAPAAPSAPAPAARKETARRSQDLFAPPPDSYSGGMSGGSLSAAPVGKRDENSVLFSLNALTASSAPSVAKTTATKEDSGLIDLKALAAAAPAAPSESVVDAVGLFPLGAPVIAPAPQPQTNYAAPVPVAEKKRSPVPIVIGGVVAVAAIVGVFMLVRGGDKPAEPTSKPATTETAGPTAKPTATVTAAPSTTPTSEPSAVASSDSSANASAQPVAGGGKPKPTTGGKPTTGSTAKPTTTSAGGTTPATTAKPAAGKGTCGCPPGNLDCMLKCSVGKKK